jgi:hypothetical protein
MANLGQTVPIGNFVLFEKRPITIAGGSAPAKPLITLCRRSPD